MARVNGHIAGTVHSETGTLIIDASATVDADIEVGVAVINGKVNGDVVAHQRVEVGSSAKITATFGLDPLRSNLRLYLKVFARRSRMNACWVSAASLY